MTISGVGPLLSPVIQSILNVRGQLDDLQRQIGTGQKATTFAGLGPQGGLAVGLDAQLAAIGNYNDAIAMIGTRISMAQTELTQIGQTAMSVKASTLGPNFAIDSTGQTTVQKSIQSQLDQILNLLNTQAGDRYLFSGKASDTPAVDTTDHILNGNGAQAGLKQLITERNQADLGVSGLGRLVIPSTVASLVGSGAAVLPDAPATGTGSVAVAGATTLASLGVTAGDTITIDDGTSQTNYVVQPGDTINSLVANLTSPPGAANVTVSVQAGRLQIQANDTTSTITVSDSSGTGADIAAIGFGAGNTSFAPTNLLTQGLSGQSLIVTIGANPPLTVGFGSLPGQVATLAGLNAMLGTLVGGTASVNPANGNLTVTAASTNDGITIAGTVNPAVFGLATTTAAPGAIISEDVAGSPFGFKLGNVLCSLTGATVTGPSGSPAGISVAFGATPPNNGESIRFTFNLPDGSTEQITLQATTASPPGANQFTIGATPAATQANLQAALTTSVDKLAHTALSAASAMAAANDFFATDFANPPLRVAGPPFNTATALVAGTPANTVSWYTGEDGPTPTRATAVARIDPTISVAYGLRANEQGIRWLVQNVAVLAATTYQQSDPNAPVSYAALNQRVGAALAVPTGTQKIDDIESSLASAQTAMAQATDRHAQTQKTLTDMLQLIEGISQEQVGSQILSLQTTLQASLQITANLSKISLVNYL